MNKALAVMDFDILQRMSIALFKSGYFQDVKNEAQAIVKVMAGSELGIPPFASMAGIHIIQGKPTLSANLIATLVKNDPRYDYGVPICNDEQCQVVWFENGRDVGDSSFTIAEAERAGLAGKENWRKYPSDMLFARALTRGARRYAPGIFGGAPVYTPEELGADVDPDGYVEGEILEHIKKAQEPVDMSDGPNYEGTGALGDKDGFIVESYPGATIDEQVADFKEPAANGKPDEEEIDHLTLCLEATDLKTFADHAYHVLDKYDNAFNVVGALVNKYPEAHGLEKFVYGKTKQGEYLNWLAERKEAAE